jgi:KipI family sensor histidine kinase inhibitor
MDDGCVHLLPVGPDAVLVEVADSRHAVSLATWAREHSLARDVVPGAETVLLDGLSESHDRSALADLLASWTPTAVDPGPEVEILVTYDGPDLDDVAERWGCDIDEAVARHQATEFVAAFCGFAPGFAYLSGLPDDLPEVPRLATPRTQVPAGSVALAGRWCGIYPTASPGGWRVIGHTDATLFDVRRESPALVAPGTHVRFGTS